MQEGRLNKGSALIFIGFWGDHHNNGFLDGDEGGENHVGKVDFLDKRIRHFVLEEDVIEAVVFFPFAKRVFSIIKQTGNSMFYQICELLSGIFVFNGLLDGFFGSFVGTYRFPANHVPPCFFVKVIDFAVLSDDKVYVFYVLEEGVRLKELVFGVGEVLNERAGRFFQCRGYFFEDGLDSWLDKGEGT